jgi:hypothetical protein
MDGRVIFSGRSDVEKMIKGDGESANHSVYPWKRKNFPVRIQDGNE